MIKTKIKLQNLEEIRVVKHTEIYRGQYKDKNYYLKILKNYNKKVKKQDVLKSKYLLENFFHCKMKCNEKS